MRGVSLPAAGPGPSDWGALPPAATRAAARQTAAFAQSEPPGEAHPVESPAPPATLPEPAGKPEVMSSAPNPTVTPRTPDLTSTSASVATGASASDHAPTASGRQEAATPAAHVLPGPSPRGLPGGRVCLVATIVVVATATVEVIVTGEIAWWAGAALVAVSVVSGLVTRRGDLVLPVMMPPLAFLVATLVAGQALVESGAEPWWTRCALMVFDVLGQNAVWVVAATASALLVCVVRWTAARVAARHRRTAA